MNINKWRCVSRTRHRPALPARGTRTPEPGGTARTGSEAMQVPRGSSGCPVGCRMADPLPPVDHRGPCRDDALGLHDRGSDLRDSRLVLTWTKTFTLALVLPIAIVPFDALVGFPPLR